MSARGQGINIIVKGLTGASKIPEEFISGIMNRMGKPLNEYAANVADQIQMDAPVLTGYLRNNIRAWSNGPTEVHVTSWAPYSGPAEIRSHRPHFFENNALPSAHIGGMMIAEESRKYLQFLINKYQNMP